MTRAIEFILLLSILTNSITSPTRRTSSIIDVKKLAYGCAEHETGKSKASITKSIDNLGHRKFSSKMIDYAICDNLINKACKFATETCNCFKSSFKEQCYDLRRA